MRADNAAPYLRAAASDLVTLGIEAIARWIGQHVDRSRSVMLAVDDEHMRAASLLGVALDADEDIVRAALRSKILDGSLHPDHGGDGVQARDLIAAQNLSIARARLRRAGGFDHA